MRPNRPALSADEVLSKLRAALMAEADVLFAYLFGSVAKGHPGPRSDVDVAVWFEENGEIVDRALALEAAIEREIDSPVNVVALNEAPLGLSFNALRSGRLILSRDERLRHRFFVERVGRYCDMEAARSIFTRYLSHRIEEGTFGGGIGDGSGAPRDH
ncbi:MAG: type VII toxin-antitoxin system MntA family adenylyltransferase antitoxin [Gemmatimonadota bacterium]